MLELVGLGAVRGKQIKALSGSMRRRVALAQALLGDPDLLVLDEPTAGLDPEQRLRFRELVSRLGEAGPCCCPRTQTEDVVARPAGPGAAPRPAALCGDAAGAGRAGPGHVWHSQERTRAPWPPWRTGTGGTATSATRRRAPSCWSPPWRTATCCCSAGTRSRRPPPADRRRCPAGCPGRGPLPPVHAGPGGGRERAAAAPSAVLARDRAERVAAVAVGQGTVPVLHYADIATQFPRWPLAAAALLATNLAVLRPHRDGAVDL